VLTAWGKLRSWVYVGHFIHGMELYEVTESLAGLPVEVEFISFDKILKDGIPDDVQVILNAGRLDTAWCGGAYWKNEKVIEAISSWVADGGGLIGIGEPSACLHSSQYFQLAHLLGVDRQVAQTFARPRRQYKANPKHFILEDTTGNIDFGDDIDDIYITGQETQVLIAKEDAPQITTHQFGNGRAIYFSGFKFAAANSRLLHRSLFWAAGQEDDFGPWTCSNIFTDCTWFPKNQKLVVVNNSDEEQETRVFDSKGDFTTVSVDPFGVKIVDK